MKNILIVVLVILVLVTTGYIINKEGSPSGGANYVNNVPSGETTTVASGKVLDLSGQKLTKAPMYVFSRTEIEELNLSNNELEGALQSQVGQLKNLKILNLSNNKFTGVPAEVGQLKNLEVLNLSNNLLTGLPYELGNLSKLKLLDLSGNNYSEQDLSKIKEKLPATTVIKTN
ncbi:MAG: leucine-rich repeat domain-containing protein [bacterium]|nr:leucine-rich repeat domain-containing protein [bacterium]